VVFEIHARFASPRDLRVPSSIKVAKYYNKKVYLWPNKWSFTNTNLNLEICFNYNTSFGRKTLTFLGQFMRSECYHSLAAQTLMGVRWNLNFVRECMKINRIRSKSHFLKNLRNKNVSSCVCVVCFTVCSLLEPFGCRFIL